MNTKPTLDLSYAPEQYNFEVFPFCPQSATYVLKQTPRNISLTVTYHNETPYHNEVFSETFSVSGKNLTNEHVQMLFKKAHESLKAIARKWHSRIIECPTKAGEYILWGAKK